MVTDREPSGGTRDAAGRPRPEGEETLDRLARDWWIFQLRRGHRYATDDVLLAWTAGRAMASARTVLDLGAGVGSVGLLTLLQLARSCHLTAVERQPASVALLRKTIAFNRLERRVRVRQRDLRELHPAPDSPRFDLIVANPPYISAGGGLRSPHPQRAAARLELHGDVDDFCAAAARWLAPGGRFCLCHAAADPRPERAIDAAGLRLLARREVVPRAGKAPLIALFTCGFAGARRDQPELVVRDAAGAFTEALHRVRRALWIEA